MPGPAVANQKGRSGLVSRRAGYYTKYFGAHDGDSFFLSSVARIEPVPRIVRWFLLLAPICMCKDP